MKLHATLLLGLLALILANGSGCARYKPWAAPPQQPPVFTEPPSLEQLMFHINTNSGRVQQLQARGASLSVVGTIAPSLSTELSLEPPRRLRLIGSTSLTGTEIDMGSNDELLWVWIKQAQPPAVYYARHDQLQQSGLASRLPLDPKWLFDALGLMTFDPADTHEGPYTRPDGKLEIRSTHYVNGRHTTRLTIVDPQYGWVLEQQMYDDQDRLAGSAIASQHTPDPASGAVLPHVVELYVPAEQMTIRLRVNAWTVNQMYGTPAQLWTLPPLQGYQYIDLGAPGALGLAPSPQTASTPPAASPRMATAPATPSPAAPPITPEIAALPADEPSYYGSQLPTSAPLQGYRGFDQRR